MTPDRTITCPICLDRYVWDDSEPLKYSISEGQYRSVARSTNASTEKLRDMRRDWYIRCPNPSHDFDNHYLPLSYADFTDPLVIAMVGRPASGKSHLLAAMVNELVKGPANGLGMTAAPLDSVRHMEFKRSVIDPFERGDRVPATPEGSARHATWLLVTIGGERCPLVFFDVAGEDYRNPGEDGRNTRFLVGADALLFVEDAAHVVADVAEAADLDRYPRLAVGGDNGANEWITDALAKLSAVAGEGRRLPAAVVITKADRLRYQPPVDSWLRSRDSDTKLSAKRILDESRDVYSLLKAHGATTVTSLYSRFDRCTLHFASATGAAALGNRYARRPNPARVLQPLIALLAMTGVHPDPDAGLVGR